MSRNRLRSKLDLPEFIGLSIVSIWLLSIPVYWFLSGLSLNYNMNFWLGVMNGGEQVEFPKWPAYIGGGVVGVPSFVVSTVTFAIDKSDVLENDPFPNN